MKHGSEGGTVEPSFIMASMHLRIAYLRLSNLSVFHLCRIRGSIVSDYALWSCESCLTSRLKVIREKKVQCGRMIGGMGAIAPDGKGTSFADLVWKPVVLIEMKRRGEDLTRHYRQAFDYWA